MTIREMDEALTEVSGVKKQRVKIHADCHLLSALLKADMVERGKGVILMYKGYEIVMDDRSFISVRRLGAERILM